MRAFVDTKFTKQQTVARLNKHAEMDQIVQQQYWDEDADGVFRGCAIGCLTHEPDGGHRLFPELFGLPEQSARLIDNVFEGLPVDDARGWPLRVIEAVPVGAVLDDAWFDALSVRRLRESVLPLAPSWPDSCRAEVVAAVEGVIAALENPAVDRPAAKSAAWSAARSADRSAVKSAAWSAAWSAAGSAESAAWSAVWSAVESAAWSAAWSAEADRLIEQLQTAG